jgi:hypothetical protein
MYKGSILEGWTVTVSGREDIVFEVGGWWGLQMCFMCFTNVTLLFEVGGWWGLQMCFMCFRLVGAADVLYVLYQRDPPRAAIRSAFNLSACLLMQALYVSKNG